MKTALPIGTFVRLFPALLAWLWLPSLLLTAPSAHAQTAGTLDSAFDPNVGGSYVAASAMQPDGKVIIAGSFATVGGAAHGNIARLNADGSVDASFTASTDATVNCVAVQADGKIVIGGDFSTVNGAARQCLARLDVDGTLESTATFNPGTVATGVVYCVAVQGDGKLVIGGGFASINGSASAGIARLNADGTLESTATFNPGTGANGEVYSVAVQEDGKILLGGYFTMVNGAQRNYLARLLADGSLESTATFNPGSGANENALVSIAVQADGKILIGGSFTAFNGSPANRIARLNADGSLDSSAAFDPGSGADGAVDTFALQADGSFLIGGSFNAINGTPRAHFAKLSNDAATASLTAPDATQVLWSRGGSGPELSQVTFEISTDGGATWSAPSSGARVGTTANWQLTGLSLPATGSVRARGRMSGGFFNGSTGLIEQIATFTVVPAGTTYDAAGDFSPAANPGGPWSYGFAASLGGSFGSDTDHFVASGLDYWNTGNGTPGVTHNGTGAAVDVGGGTILQPGQLTLHPGESGDFSVIRFTVPAGGQYTVDATFTGLSDAPATTDVHVLQDGSSLFDGSINLSGQGNSAHFSSTLILPASATLDFVVGWGNGNYSSDTTSLALTITQGPSTPGLAVTTDSYSNLSSTSVTWHGTVNPNGLATDVYFVDQFGAFFVQTVPAGNAPVAFSATYAVTAGTTYTFHAYAVNSSGSADGAPISFTPPAPATDPVTTVLFGKGNAVPGAGVTGSGIPGGSQFSSFGAPSINDAGTVAFFGKWKSPAGSGAGIFVGNPAALLVKVGDGVPGLSGAKFKSFNDPVLDKSGRIAAVATISGTGLVTSANDSAVISNGGGVMAVAAREGFPVGAFAGAPLWKTFAALSIDGTVAGHSTVFVRGTLTGTGVSTGNDSALASILDDGAVGGVLLLRKGDVINGKTVKTIGALIGRPGAVGQGPLQGAGPLPVTVTWSDNTQSLLDVSADGTLDGVLKTGDAVAKSGIVATKIGLAARGGDGVNAYAGSAKQGGKAYSGIWVQQPGSSHFYYPAITSGLSLDPAGAFNSPALIFTGFQSPVVDSHRDVAYIGSVKLNGTTDPQTGVWYQNSSLPGVGYAWGGRRIALSRENAAEAGGAQWASFISLALPDDPARGPLFTARLLPGTGGVSADNDIGLWAVDSFGALRLIVREGQVIGGKTVKTFTALTAIAGSPGVSRSFNNAGQIVYLAAFTDGSTALLAAQVP